MTFTIRRATLEDKPVIFAFLDQAYGVNAKDKYPERWEWQFEHNPYKPDNKIPVYIALNEEGKVVAQSAAVYEPLQIDGKRQDFAWAVDAFVLEDYRGKNLGFETLRMNRDHHPIWMGMVMAPSSRHILTKLGCKEIESVSLFRKLIYVDKESIVRAAINDEGRLRWMAPVVSVVKKLHLDDFASKAINLVLNLRNPIRLAFYDKSIMINKIDHFGTKFDEFWQLVKSNYPVSIIRDSEFLRWKYELQPGLDYRVFTADYDGDMRGYMILRSATEQDNTGIIADLLTFPNDTDVLNALVNFAIRYFRDEKMKYISAATSLACQMTAFESLGFKKYKEILPLLYLVEDKFEQVFSSGMWYLGRSDHDWDQLYLG